MRTCCAAQDNLSELQQASTVLCAAHVEVLLLYRGMWWRAVKRKGHSLAGQLLLFVDIVGVRMDRSMSSPPPTERHGFDKRPWHRAGSSFIHGKGRGRRQEAHVDKCNTSRFGWLRSRGETIRNFITSRYEYGTTQHSGLLAPCNAICVKNGCSI